MEEIKYLIFLSYLTNVYTKRNKTQMMHFFKLCIKSVLFSASQQRAVTRRKKCVLIANYIMYYTCFTSFLFHMGNTLSNHKSLHFLCS